MKYKKEPIHIDFIGAGNVAWHLAPALENAGVIIKNVYSRNSNNAQKLADKLYEAEVKTNLNFSNSQADILLMAVSDQAIEELCKELVVPEHIVLAHTSGATPLAALHFTATDNVGVFYPLQTFTKAQKVNFASVPILVESTTSKTKELLTKTARLLSKSVQNLSSAQRKRLHVAAVFASNFTNWMLNRATEVMQDANLDIQLLHPLIVQSISNALELGAAQVLTGPAKRKDLTVLDEHMELLKNTPDLQELYQLITQQIIDYYQEE